MLSSDCRPEHSHRLSASLLACVLIATGASACDRASDPNEPPVDPPTVVDALADPGVPLDATSAEQAMLAAPVNDEAPPDIVGLAAAQSQAAASASTCTIGFADEVGLLILPDQAGYTFASSPFYIQGCGSGWVHVKENDDARYGPSWGSGYLHYHLMYQKGPYCTPANGPYGYRNSSGTCVKVADPEEEPRYLASHAGDQWIRIYVYKSGVSEMTFDFRSITVKGNQPIKLWFRRSSGSWAHWNSLGAGTWNVAPYAASIREILISASGNSFASYSFDTIKVTVN
jgi:hypothetical protein